MLRAENKQCKRRGWGGSEDERQRGETVGEWSANASCSFSLSLGQRFMGDVHDMASSSRKPLALPLSHMSPFILPPASWSHRSCSSPAPLAAPAQRGSWSRLKWTYLTSLKGTSLLKNKEFKGKTRRCVRSATHLQHGQVCLFVHD